MAKTQIAELIADVKEQLLYAKELGIDAIAAELPESVNAVARERPAMPKVRPEANVPFAKPPVKAPAPTAKTRGSRIASLPSLKKRPPVEVQVPEVLPTDEMLTPAPAPVTEPVAPMRLQHANDTIDYIRAEIGDCTRCPLHEGRIQIVHTTGNFQADLMFVGEAPGADEDEQGRPFVGRAGQLLTKIIESIGMSRDEVCIGNINRCRPPGNRKPEPNETAACRPFLLREIAVVKPRVIVVLGATAAHNLLQVKTPITKLRGEFHDYFGVKVMPTFHPAYLLRDPHKKREVWDDMKKVRDLLNNKID
jgi:uracil-DNA glycosylase family 4